MADGNGWGEHKLLVLNSLEKSDEKIGQLFKRLDDIRSKDIADLKADIAALREHARLSGAIGGIIASIIVGVFIWLLTK